MFIRTTIIPEGRVPAAYAWEQIELNQGFKA